MDQVICHPAFFSGDVTVPSSKSATHRAVLCAALARGESVLSPVILSRDIEATIAAVCGLGAHAEYTPDTKELRIHGIESPVRHAVIQCGESGSTLRFLIPVAASLGCSATFLGEGRLPARPVGCYTECLPPHGVACTTESGLPFSVHGHLQPGEFILPGNISSQFITGLLFALPLLDGDSRITLSSPLESAGYVELTLSVLKDFGITILPDAKGWFIPGGQTLTARAYTIEGDWSQAAFFMAMGALSKAPAGVCIHGLRADSVQGDKAAVDIFRRFGAEIIESDRDLIVRPGTLRGITVDAADIPDLVPAIAACAAFCPEKTVIQNAARLRIKESDRLFALEHNLRALGVAVSSTKDSLTIVGRKELPGGTCSGFRDHRIVMAMAVCTAGCTDEITITDADSIQKSYPDFFKDYNQLGGNAHVVHMG